LVAHLHFLPILKPKLKNAKELPSLHTTTQQKTNEMERLEKALGHNRGLNAMGAEVVNSIIVLLLHFCDKLNICASNPPLRQAPKRYKQA
jgi:hypothetical protein